MVTISYHFFNFNRCSLAQKENKLKVIILTYIVLFAVLYGVCNTNIYYTGLMPFGVSLVFSLLYVRFNGYYLSIVYFLSYTLAGFRLISVYEAINVSLVLVFLQYYQPNQYQVHKCHIFLSSIVSQLVYIILNIGDTKQNLALFVSFVLGLLFLYSNICFFNATLNRGMMIKLNLDEKICGSVILIIFMIGMSSSNIYFINLGLVLASLIILVGTYITSGGITLIIASLIGISFAITTNNPIFISLFTVMAIFSISFKCHFKYLSVIATIFSYAGFSLFFSIGISYWEIISVSLGGLIFSFVPLKLLDSFNNIFNVKTQVIIKNIINKSKKQIIKRVEELSVVFAEMDRVYRNMVKGILPDDKAKIMLKDELISSICDDCPNKNFCFRGESNFLDNSIDTLINIAYEKGKVLLIDLPVYLTSNCVKINQMIMALNSMITSYKEYTGVISNLDTSRILIADQLNGVSKLLESLSKEVDTNISFDSTFENRIKEELSYKNIVCLECAVYEKDITNKYVNLIIKTDTINRNVIEKIVSKITNNKLTIKSIEPSEIVGASLVCLVTMPNYDIAFGSSSVNKFGKRLSGDSHSLLKIDDGKFMVSICDGMGSGNKAHNISKLTISLIENFYRAGFENDIILSTVNKLLSLTEEENYSSIDLCIIDGRKNIYDFIKLGATNGYLKRDKGDCEEIKSNDLPVGILEEISPHITKKLINPFDMLVFVSDGISDSFENKIDLRLFISSMDTINPQSLSEEILNKALELNDNIPKDDMTVVCVRVFNNV